MKQGDNDLASKVKMERNGGIWDIFLKVDLEGIANGVHIRSMGKRKIKND